jgi:hypothetical protein
MKYTKKQQYLRQLKFERKRKREKRITKKLNIIRSIRKKDASITTRRGREYNTSVPPKEETIRMNTNFSILESPNNVLRDIQSITTVTNKYQEKRKYKIDLSGISKIDIGAVGILLSKINELGSRNISVWGNFPDDKDCQNFMYESGFLDHMKDLRGRKFSRNQENKNLLIRRGFDRTSNKIIGKEIKKAVLHLTGVEETFRPVFSMAQEMCANSIEHANKDTCKKNWLFTIYYNSDKVVFTMTDVGQGILSTLKRKASQIISDKLKLNDIEVLDGAFEKKYQSATSDKNRNKGLPKIKRINDSHFVDNLIVITNNVLIDFNNENKSRSLDVKFNGTFYYWELTKNCIERWKQRKLN